MINLSEIITLENNSIFIKRLPIAQFDNKTFTASLLYRCLNENYAINNSVTLHFNRVIFII